jgi:hypothetical protein
MRSATNSGDTRSCAPAFVAPVAPVDGHHNNKPAIETAEQSISQTRAALVAVDTRSVLRELAQQEGDFFVTPFVALRW